MNTPKVLFAIVGSLFTSFPFLANAVDVQLLPSKDNTIYEEGDLSNALGDYLFAGKTRSSDLVELDGRTVDTGDYLGYIDIDNRPWIYVYSLASWIYLPEDQISQDGAWGYLPR